jgi:hypothetical protein
VLLAGPEKSGKSWILHDLAVATVAGGNWLGRFPIRRPGSVVILDAEYGDGETARRLARIARGRGLDPSQVLTRVRHLYSFDLRLHHDDRGLLDLCRDLEADPPAVVIVDPLRNHLNGSENEAETVLDASYACAAMRGAAAAPVVVAHHLNKSGGTSGSRALLGRADLLLEGTDEAQPWYGTRGRRVRQGDAIASRFTVQIQHEHDDDDSRARTVLALRFEGENAGKTELSVGARRMLDVLRLRTEPASEWALRRKTRQNAAVARRALEELEGKGQAKRQGKSWVVDTAAFLRGLPTGECSSSEVKP